MLWIALAAFGVAVVSLGWTVWQDRRIGNLEIARERRETGAVLSVIPGNFLQWERHHQDAEQVTDMLGHITNAGRVDSPPIHMMVLIDGEQAGQSPLTSVPAGRTVEARAKLVFKRAGSRQPNPVGAGTLRLQLFSTDGKAELARWPQ